ncbi:MAG: acyl-CoA synthetase, AMP-(fatty) acid ligase [Burkholderiaceae bacterium]|jgi:acyl-coenzyme A synthetase/AMP-(fatty) acid ligase|nr:MAG: acyl-CoA synthetase, AMP-(fatty) acid ligase [Burkholderiaceae bacterium]
MSPSYPLLPDGPGEATIAFRSGRPVRRDQFIADLTVCAARLGDATHAIPLCGDRYWFSIAFLACIARGVVSLLPSSSAPEHLAALAAQAPGTLVLLDHDAAPLSPLRCVRIDTPAGAARAMPQQLPRIRAAQCVARVYTSGSTGEPQGHDKFFGCLMESVAAASRRVWTVAGAPCTVVGTPSFRHMYGLESTVLLPLFGAGRLADSQPFLPADIATALDELPEPRLLVTTPFHLRKLLESGLKLPRLAALLSATAPLSQQLARQAEAELGAPLLEIYGATEVGQVATRRPGQCAEWTALDGLALTRRQDATFVSGAALHRPQPLNDVVELLDSTHFRLIDRGAHLINIFGKRSSLGFLNQLLLQIPGVKDGAFYLPESKQDDVRPAAFVVAPGQSAADIVAALRPYVDPVFLPRPLVLIDELPRDANGKVLARTLRQLAATHLGAKT